MDYCIECGEEYFEFEYEDEDGEMQFDIGCMCYDDPIEEFEEDPQGFIERNGYIPTGAFDGYYS